MLTGCKPFPPPCHHRHYCCCLLAGVGSCCLYLTAGGIRLYTSANRLSCDPRCYVWQGKRFDLSGSPRAARVYLCVAFVFAHDFKLLSSQHHAQAIGGIYPVPKPPAPPARPPPLDSPPHLRVARDVDGDAAADVARAEARAAGAETTNAEVDATRHMATKHTIWAKLNIGIAAAVAAFASVAISSGVGSFPAASGVARKGWSWRWRRGTGWGSWRRFFRCNRTHTNMQMRWRRYVRMRKSMFHTGKYAFHPLFSSTMVDFQNFVHSIFQ